MKRTIKKVLIFCLVLVVAFLQTGCFFLNFFLSPLPEKLTKYEDPTKVEIVFEDGNFSKTNESIVRSCYLVVDEGRLNASDYEIEWKINNEPVSAFGASYGFYPSTTAKVLDVSATLFYTNSNGEKKSFVANDKFIYCNEITDVNVVENVTNSSVSYQIQNVDENLNVIDWEVDGVSQSSSASFSFEPYLGGTYQVSLTVNGTNVPLQNSTINIVGNSEIKDLYVDYDTHYPNVKVSWNGQKYDGEYQITVQTLTTSMDYFTTLSEMEFTQQQFPINSVSVTVLVKALGTDTINASQTKSASVNKLSFVEQEYLSTSYGIENAYITNDEEFYVQFDFMMLSREQPKNGEETMLSRNFYMAYDCKNIDDLSSYAFDKSSYAGNYRLGADLIGNIATVDLYFKTVNEPIISQNAVIPSSYYSNMNGYKPYQNEVVAPIERLPIDSKIPIEVTTTDMLYRVAEMGYCPSPKQGSRAQTYYAYARELLQSIISADYTEYEIALAIYDWLIYTNNYDNSVTEMEIEQAVQSPAFYIEGVLTPNYGYSVCDGMAKTYSLLCNMMGIECLRVTGVAGEGENKGGHAWNKIKIDGNWYVVDPTWGDQTVALEYKESALPITITRTFELGLHSYFLTTDANISNTHDEDDYGYPVSSLVPYPHYKQKSAGSYDWYLNESGTALTSAISEIREQIINSLNVINSFVAYNSTVTSNFFMYEIGFCKENRQEVASHFSKTSSLVRQLKLNGYYYEFFETESTIVIIISKRCRLLDIALS